MLNPYLEYNQAPKHFYFRNLPEKMFTLSIIVIFCHTGYTAELFCLCTIRN